MEGDPRPGEVRDRQGSIASDGGSRKVPASSLLTRMWEALRRHVGKRAVCVGLDDAGKTAMIYYMKRGQHDFDMKRYPTIGYHNDWTVSDRGWDAATECVTSQLRPLCLL